MSAEEFRTGQDVFNAVMRQAGQTQSLTDQYAQDVRIAIMQEYKSILARERWYWAKAPRPGVLTTVSRIQSSCTIAGATVTLGSSQATSLAGRKFYLDSNLAFYRIIAHTAGTPTLTLDATYVETQSAGRCTVYQDEYSLAADVLNPWSPFHIRGQWERDVDLIEEKKFRALYGWSTTTAISIPEAATLIRTDVNQIPVIQLAPWTTSAINLEYDYVAIPETLTFDGDAGTDTPTIPEPFRWVLYQRALSQLYATKNDDLSERAWKRAEVGIGEMIDVYMSQSTENQFFCRPRHGLGVS